MIGTFLTQTKDLMMKPHIICGDGFTFSLQDCELFHCKTGSVEIGAVSRREPLLKPYHEGDGVYGYVPLSVVDQILTKHKGINYREVFGDINSPFRVCEYCRSYVLEHEDCPHCGAPHQK